MDPRRNLPAFPYGAVYFRKSNPPQEDWARDYRTAADDGMNIFRHWFLWSAVEQSPGKFDWSDYDRQLDLAAENGIKTIIAEMITSAPEWAYRELEHARFERRDGSHVESHISGSCVIGGFPGLCLDNEDYRALAERFLRELVLRYKDHPGLGGYDIWNESNYSPDVCYCPATAAKFREWLKAKYGELAALGEAWHRPSFAKWEYILPPRDLGPYPHVMDWLEFRIDDAYRLMRWRADIIRELDPNHPVTAHGVVGSLTKMAQGGADDWRAASEAESFGYTWGSSRHGDEPWKQMHAVDLVRAASRGKPFWHAETYGGPLWMQPQVIGKPRDEGRIASPEDIRYWNMTSMMCGATGLLFLRWRSLLDGPLFGAFGPYGMDGSRTDRSEMANKVGRWAQAAEQNALWRSGPVKGEIGILYVPETQIFSYAQQGHTEHYAASLEGAYQAFWDLNIQADWVHFEDRLTYDTLYLPFPIMLKAETARRLVRWVERGGTLICEGCPSYWDETAHVSPQQPAQGLSELFGVQESYVEFTPDILGDLEVNIGGETAWGGIFMQAYTPTTGTPRGWYDDGQVAVVDNAYGNGKTRLIGTMAGAGYGAHPVNRSAAWFRQALDYAGVSQRVICSDSQVKVRMHDGDGGMFLWVANATRQDRPVRIQIQDDVTGLATLWGAEASLDGDDITLVAPARDITVLVLR